MSFAIVEFLDEEAVEVVCNSWIFTTDDKKKKCYWPHNHPKQKAKKNQLPDKDNWSIYNVRVFGYSDDYSDALVKCNKALETSNIEGCELHEGIRPKKRPRRYLDEEDKGSSLNDVHTEKVLEDISFDEGTTSSQEFIESTMTVQIGKILGNQNKILKLLETKSSASDAENNFFEMVPLDNEIEFSELEENLKNKTTRRYLVQYLWSTRGKGVGETIRRAMKHIGTYKLWSTFSYKGRKGKKPFMESKLCKVIVGTVIKAHETTIKAVEDEVSAFLKHAPNKPGGSNFSKQNKTCDSSNTSISSGSGTFPYLSSDSEE